MTKSRSWFDLDQINEEDKNKLDRQFGFQEAESGKHRMQMRPGLRPLQSKPQHSTGT